MLALIVLGLFLVVAQNWVNDLEPLQQAPIVPFPDPIEQPARDDAHLAELLRVLPLEMLLAEWRDADRGAPAGERDRSAAHLRSLLVEELWHRDPTGVERWLRAGAAQPPELYLHGDQDLTA